MTLSPDYGAHPSVRARWRKGSHIRAVKRYVRKACLAVVEYLESVTAARSMLERPAPDASLSHAIALALIDGKNGGATVIKEADGALVHKRGPMFNDTVRA